MSRGRFGLVVTLLAMGVAAVAFAAGLQVFDDGKADPPPTAGSGEATDTSAAIDGSSTTTATTAPAPTTPPGALKTPAWIAIVGSEASQALAEEKAGLVTAKGHPAGVLHSDDYKSLKPGLWVAYAGPYADASAAEAGVETLAENGFAGAYVRCAGSEKDCKGDDD